eukprot:9208101-Alexandrium_andersonii.AAC.1
MALQEGAKLRRLISYTRYLFRNSRHGSHNPVVRDLKALLQKKRTTATEALDISLLWLMVCVVRPQAHCTHASNTYSTNPECAQ